MHLNFNLNTIYFKQIFNITNNQSFSNSFFLLSFVFLLSQGSISTWLLKFACKYLYSSDEEYANVLDSYKELCDKLRVRPCQKLVDQLEGLQDSTLKLDTIDLKGGLFLTVVKCGKQINKYKLKSISLQNLQKNEKFSHA